MRIISQQKKSDYLQETIALVIEIHNMMKEDLNCHKNKIKVKKLKVREGREWKYCLADTIAASFRCKMYLEDLETICFYGYNDDCKLARLSYKQAYRGLLNYLSDIKDNLNCYEESVVLINDYHKELKEKLGRKCIEDRIEIPKMVEMGFNEKVEQFFDYNAGVRYAIEN